MSRRLRMELAELGVISWSAMAARAAIKFVSERVRRPDQVADLVERGFGFCIKMGECLEAVEARERGELWSTQVAAYDLYEPLREQKISPEIVRESLVLVDLILLTVAIEQIPEPDLAGAVIQFLDVVIVAYQGTAVRLLARDQDLDESMLPRRELV